MSTMYPSATRLVPKTLQLLVHASDTAHALLNSGQGGEDGVSGAVGRHTAAYQSEDSPNLLFWQFVDQVMKLFTLHAHMTSLSVNAQPHLHT